MIVMNRINQLLLLCAGLALGAAGCAYDETRYQHANGSSSNEANGQGFQVKVDWLKNKSDGTDVQLWVLNNYDQPITVGPTAFNLIVDGQARAVKRSTLRTMLGAHESTRGVVTFVGTGKMAPNTKAILEAKPVYASPGGAAITPLKLELLVQ